MATGYQCLRLRAIRSGPSTATANLQLLTSSSKTLSTPRQNYASMNNTSSVKPMSESGWERDPSLPPKPPPGTYPHPFPEARDDPHSNSMRATYQHPPRMHASSRPSASSYSSSVNASTSTSASTSPMPNRYAALNQLSGLSFSEPDIMASNLPPLYVIHVKASSNNTIITLHAPPTPKILDISSTLPLSGSGGGKGVRDSAPTRTRWDDPTPEKVTSTFSVESNPDAAPVEEAQVVSAVDVQAEATASTAVEEGEPKEDVGQDVTTEAAAPTPVELPKQSVQIVAPPTANRCIGWASGGSCHYRKVQRSTYEAGHAASIRIIRRVEEAYRHLASGGKIEDIPPMKEVVKDARQERLEMRGLPAKDSGKTMALKVVYTGFGTGRDAFNAAMLSAEGGFVRGLIGQ
ncbi:hypothetical protein FRC17_003257, partial [Serendipita sp. 399]